MAVAWKLVRVPAELHAELVKLTQHFDRMQTAGKMNVPSRFADPRGGHVGTPLWYVIRRSLDEWREKKRRSRAKRQGQGTGHQASGNGQYGHEIDKTRCA